MAKFERMRWIIAKASQLEGCRGGFRRRAQRHLCAPHGRLSALPMTCKLTALVGLVRLTKLGAFRGKLTEQPHGGKDRSAVIRRGGAADGAAPACARWRSRKALNNIGIIVTAGTAQHERGAFNEFSGLSCSGPRRAFRIPRLPQVWLGAVPAGGIQHRGGREEACRADHHVKVWASSRRCSQSQSHRRR